MIISLAIGMGAPGGPRIRIRSEDVSAFWPNVGMDGTGRTTIEMRNGNRHSVAENVEQVEAVLAEAGEGIRQQRQEGLAERLAAQARRAEELRREGTIEK